MIPDHKMRYILSTIIFFIALSVPVTMANGAGLYLSPPTGVYEVGEILEVRVMVDPGIHSINAVEGEIDISESGLELIDISTEGSGFGIWTQDPSVSADGGKIVFGGGRTSLLSGNASSMFTFRIRSEDQGVKRIRFLSGAIMAPDGVGAQNVISELTSGAYTFVASPADELSPDPEFMAPSGSPGVPVVSSDTHPDDDIWYSERDVRFYWERPEDVIAVRAEFNQRPFTIPQSEIGSVDSMEYEDVLDGEWFFHLQFKNNAGWGDILHRSVRIDATAPELFELKKKHRDDKSDPRIGFSILATDEMSGMDHFSFHIDGILDERFSGTRREVELGPLPPGVHTLIARAVDGAGNHRTESLVLEIEPIDPPIFIEVPGVIHSGSIMAMRGRSFPNSTILVSLERRGEEPETHAVKADEEGVFTFIAPKKPADGIYTVKAKAMDGRGAQSLFTDAITVAVQPPGFIRLGGIVVNGLSMFVSLLAMVVFLVVGSYWGMHKWRIFRRRLSKEIKEAEEEVHETFENLRKKNSYQLSLLNKAERSRELTEEEKKIKEQLREDMDTLGVSAEKEVHDIKKAFDR